jgi:hypothetical protein
MILVGGNRSTCLTTTLSATNPIGPGGGTPVTMTRNQWLSAWTGRINSNASTVSLTATFRPCGRSPHPIWSFPKSSAIKSRLWCSWFSSAISMKCRGQWAYYRLHHKRLHLHPFIRHSLISLTECNSGISQDRLATRNEQKKMYLQIKVKVKVFRYKPEVTLGVPGG